MDLSAVRVAISERLTKNNELSALLIRFAWHCCGTYDANRENGGSNGCTIRFDAERNDPENRGFAEAYKLFEEVLDEVPDASKISKADLYVLGGYVAIEWTGGPQIPFSFGRVDYSEQEATEIYGESKCPFGDGRVNPNGSRLPAADLGKYDHPDLTMDLEREQKTINGIRSTFERMGFDDRETVALIILGHQYGRAHSDVSGFDGFWFPFAAYDWTCVRTSKGGFLSLYDQALDRFKEAYTENGLRQFETRIYGTKHMMLVSDMALLWDPDYKKWLKFYHNNRESFWRDSQAAWKKLTELGCDGILTPEVNSTD